MEKDANSNPMLKKRTKSNFHFCQKIPDFDDALSENHPYVKKKLTLTNWSWRQDRYKCF